MTQKKDWKRDQSMSMTFSRLMKKIPMPIKAVMDEVIDHINPSKLRSSYITTINSIMAHLFDVYITEGKTRVHYSRSTPSYTKYKYASYTTMVKVVDALNELGWTEERRSTNHPENKFQSSLWATPKLEKVFAASRQDINIQMDGLLVLRKKNKDGTRTSLPIPKTAKAKRMASSLAWINNQIQNHHTITLHGDVRGNVYDGLSNKTTVRILNKGDFVFRRVFNNKATLTEGGRFYASFQNIRKADRHKIRLDGEHVVEIDFKSIHIAILYSMLGKTLNHDPYDVKGHCRMVAKVALNIMINANNHTAAQRAISQFISSSTSEKYDARRVKDLMLKLKLRNAEIAKFINTGMGVQLQYIDSKIAEQVMTNMLKKRVCCLSLHDSFIVPLSKAEMLRKEMIAASKSVIGVELEVDVKSCSFVGTLVRGSSLVANSKSRGASLFRDLDIHRTSPENDFLETFWDQVNTHKQGCPYDPRSDILLWSGGGCERPSPGG